MTTFTDGEAGALVRAKINSAISKVDALEAGATADQTPAEIKAAYESNPDTNVFDDAAVAALSAAGGTMTAAEIKTAYESNADTNVFDDAAVAALLAAEANPAVVSQGEAEAGVGTTARLWTAVRVSQAIAALAAGGSSGITTAGAAPTTAPPSAGQFWIDTAGPAVYFSVGIATVADWVKIIDSAGGTTLPTAAVTAAGQVPFFDAANGDAPSKATWTAVIAALKLFVSDATSEAGASLTNAVSLTTAQYGALTPTAGVMYLITDAT